MNIFLIHRMHEENKKSPLTWHQSKYSSARKRAAEDLDGSDNEEKGVWSDWHHETRQPGSSLNIHLELQDCEHFTILNQNHRTYMRDRGKKKDGQRNVLPPQIFNGDDYIGVRKKNKGESFSVTRTWEHIFNRILRTLTSPTRTICWRSFLGSSVRIPRYYFQLNNSQLTFPGGAVQNGCGGSRGGEKGGWEAAEGEDSGCEEGRSSGNSSPISLNISLSKTPKWHEAFLSLLVAS